MDLGRGSFVTLLIWLSLLVAGTSWASQGKSQELLGDPEAYSVPFQEGESLRYEVNWKPLFLIPAFKAGELAFSIRQSEYQERPTYTITAAASSEGLLSSVAGMEIRDRFESNIDRKTFRSYRILRQIRQNKRKRDLEVLFDYDRNSILVREINLEKDSPEEIRSEEIQGIPGPVADILSVFYVARLRPLRPGDTYSIYLNDRGKIKRVQIKVHAREKVTTDIGTFEAVKISTVGGLFRNGGNLRVWYSTDQLRFPVKFEADAKVGTVYGKVIALETPRMTRSVIRID